MNNGSAKARSIFTSAVEDYPPDQWDAFLDDACRDDVALRRRVELLLRAHRGEDSFLDRGDDDAATTIDRPIAEGPGTVIGPYKLLEQIGEGGFGVVFLAEQERPVRRRVALKVIKPGMDTREVIARFEAERQALALMDHPHIAKVHDAGATENGRPYFVMELVQGVPITEYCDQCNLSTKERLELFVTVCQAVQHAHQKGVIHRDIKPTNVFVALQDGQPAPKIIDFGVAKAINQRLTERTLATGFAQMVGTPMYMSPEQAELSPLGVDTRSDIYSLGALLYELLTGATPFDQDRLQAASYDEFRRIIREEEPPRPSARISTLAADRAETVAEHRRTDARRLRQTVHGELDWIVMKCLEKDRNRRYETPNSLARDVERYLHDEPVQACPPSTSYRFRKFARRNKSLLAAGGAIAAALFIGLGLSTWMYFRERAAVQVAKANEMRATTETTKAKTVSDLLQEMLASSNPDQVKGSKYTVRELLDDFSAGLGNQLAGQPEVEAAIRSVIGKSYWRLGAYDRAELHLKNALDLRRQVFGANDERVADTLVDYAWSLSEQVRNAEAEACVRDALLIYRTNNSDPRAIVRALWSLQEFLMRESRFAESEQVANDALALAGDGKDSDFSELPNILHGLANAKADQGKFAEAEELARRAVRIHRRLQGDHHPETAFGLWNLGQALKGEQKFAAAEPPLREALAIFREYYTPEDRSIRLVTRDLAFVLEAQGDLAGLEMLTNEEAAQESRSDSPDYQARLAKLLLTNNSQGKSEEAHRIIGRAIDGYVQVAIGYPNDLDRRLKAAMGFVALIDVCGATPGFAYEIDESKRRLAAELPQLALIAKRLTEPASLANALYYVAVMQLRVGDEAGYRVTCKALVDLPGYIANDVVKARRIWTLCLAPNAVEDPNLVVRRGEELVANSSSNYPHFGIYVLGAALYRAGQYERAAERLKESIAAFPSNPPPQGYDTINYQQLLLAMTKWQRGQPDEARQLLAETLPAVDKELQSPSTFWNRRATLDVLRNEAETLIKQKDPNKAPNSDNPMSADH